MNGLALFAGVGGLELGVNLIIPDSRTVCYVEGETYNIEVIQNKIEKKQLEEALIFSDVRAFRQICHIFSGKVDFITAGFPCQPFSTAGELKGTNDERWLWDSILEIISQVRPSYLFLENVSNLVNQFGAFDEISKSLSQIGFNLEWGTLRASDIGANHHRNRLFIFGYYKGTIEQIKPIVPYANEVRWGEVKPNLWRGQFDPLGGYNDANTDSKRRNQLDNAKESIKEKRKLDNGNNSFGNVTDYIQESGNDANANGINSTKRGKHEVNEKSCSTREDNPPRSKNNGRERRFQISSQIERGEISKFAKYGINQPAWWQNEPSICRVVDGVAFGMDRIRACGNGVVPLQAAMAYYTLIQRAKGVNQ